MKRLAKLLVLALIVSLSSISAEAKPKIRFLKPRKQSLADALFKCYPELRGSPETLKKFNDIADDAGLSRIDDKVELELRVASGFLVPVPEQTQDFYLDKDSFKECFPAKGGSASGGKVKSKKGAKETCFGDRRYLTPQALEYLNGLSWAYSDVFSDEKHQKRMKIPSLVRTMAYQRFIARGNPNAKEVLCDVDAEDHSRCSAHSTGYAFDVSTRDLEKEGLLWIAGFLAKDIAAGKILAIYEYKAQANFHVMVIPK